MTGDFPKPIPYSRALRLLNMREDPWMRVLATYAEKNGGGNESKVTQALKRRPAVRIVADLFRTTPLQVAKDMVAARGRNTLAINWSFTQPDEKPLWAIGRGAW
jgi:hypothetical protein